MDADAERTLRNLSVLARLKQNDKLMTLADTFVITPPTVTRELWRRWYGEARAYNLERVYEVLKAAMAFLVSQKEQNAELPFGVQRERLTRAYDRMIAALDASRKGLANLKDTYYDDTTFQVRLQLMMQEVDDFLASINCFGLSPGASSPCASTAGSTPTLSAACDSSSQRGMRND